MTIAIPAGIAPVTRCDSPSHHHRAIPAGIAPVTKGDSPSYSHRAIPAGIAKGDSPSYSHRAIPAGIAPVTRGDHNTQECHNRRLTEWVDKSVSVKTCMSKITRRKGEKTCKHSTYKV